MEGQPPRPRLRRDAGTTGLPPALGYVLVRFVAPTCAAALFGAWAPFSTFTNLVLAELLHGGHDHQRTTDTGAPGWTPMQAAASARATIV